MTNASWSQQSFAHLEYDIEDIIYKILKLHTPSIPKMKEQGGVTMVLNNDTVNVDQAMCNQYLEWPASLLEQSCPKQVVKMKHT